MVNNNLLFSMYLSSQCSSESVDSSTIIINNSEIYDNKNIEIVNKDAEIIDDNKVINSNNQENQLENKEILNSNQKDNSSVSVNIINDQIKKPNNIIEYIKKYGEPSFYIKINGGAVLGWNLQNKFIFRIFNIIGICDKKMNIKKKINLYNSSEKPEKSRAIPFITVKKKYPSYDFIENIEIYAGYDKYYIINTSKVKRKVVTLDSIQEEISCSQSDFRFKNVSCSLNDSPDNKNRKKKKADKNLHKMIDIYGAPLFTTGDCKGHELLFFVKNYKSYEKNNKFSILIAKLDVDNKLHNVWYYNSEKEKVEEYGVFY